MCVRKGCQGPRDEQLAAELPCPPATRGSEGQEALRALPLSVEASAATRGGHRANAEVQGAPSPDQGSTTVLEMFPMSCLSSWLQSLWSPAGTWSPKSPHHDGQSILSCGSHGASTYQSLQAPHPHTSTFPRASAECLLHAVLPWEELGFPLHKKITFAQTSERFSLRQKLLYVKRSTGVGKFTALVTATAVCDQYNLNFFPLNLTLQQ